MRVESLKKTEEKILTSLASFLNSKNKKMVKSELITLWEAVLNHSMKLNHTIKKKTYIEKSIKWNDEYISLFVKSIYDKESIDILIDNYFKIALCHGLSYNEIYNYSIEKEKNLMIKHKHWENKLLKGDCLKLMKYIPTSSIDLILADLPYGTTKNSWDTLLPYDALWKEYERVITENGAILLFAQAPFDKTLANSNLKLFRYEWIWEKTTASGFLNAKKMPMKAHENILVFYKKLPTYNPIKTKGERKVSLKAHKVECKESHIYGKHKMNSIDYNSDERFPRSVIKFKTDKQKSAIHSTQKPIELLKYMVCTYTNENELVLDNTMGSGSTVVACLQTNRRYIGIEKEKKTFNEAKKRVDYVKKSGVDTSISKIDKINSHLSIQKSLFDE